jgi:hypothetical protein
MTKNWAGGEVQGEDPEFKLHDLKKTKNKTQVWDEW